MVAEPGHVEIVRVVDTCAGITFEYGIKVLEPSGSCNRALLALCTSLATRNYIPLVLKRRSRFGRLWYIIRNHKEFRRLFGWRGLPRQLWWAWKGVG